MQPGVPSPWRSRSQKGADFMWMIVFAALVLISAASGFVALRAQSSVRATVAQGISLVATGSAMLLLGLVIAPRMEEIYVGFGTELPTPTVWALTAARQMRVSWILTILNVLSFTAGGIVLFYGYHVQPQHRTSVRWCWLLASGVLTAMLWTAGTAIFLPMQALLQDLS